MIRSSLAICFLIPLALSSVSALRRSTVEPVGLLLDKDYLLHYDHQPHNPIFVPVQVIQDFDQVHEVGRLRRRGLFYNNKGFRLTSFKCAIPNDKDLCHGAKETAKTALEMLDQIFELRENIKVKVIFREFLEVEGNAMAFTTSSEVLMVSSETGKRRVYPSALAKQIHTTPLGEEDPIYAKLDIILEIDSRTKFYLPTENRKIASHEYDLLMVMLHEIVHGMGFLSSWKDYHGGPTRGLTPDLAFHTMLDGTIRFTGYVEAAFDRYLINTSDSTYLSDHLDALNNMPVATTGTAYNNLKELFSDIEKDPVYREISELMLDLATRPGSIAFLSRRLLRLELETSLDPFNEDSSISHVDSKLYQTRDFLMTHEHIPGKSLADLICKTESEGPLGPLIFAALDTMGYSRRLKNVPLDSFPFWQNYMRYYKSPPTEPSCFGCIKRCFKNILAT